VNADIGFVQRSVTLGSIAGHDKALIEQRGFGFEVIAGAQYVDIIEPVRDRDQTDGTPLEFGQLFDGVRVACPGGFVALLLRARSDVPVLGVARVVVRIFTLPSVVNVSESGLAAKASVGLLNSPLHSDVGETLHLTIPAGGQVLLHDDAGQGFQANVDPIVAGTHRSRTIGDEGRVWWPTHALYFYGFLVSTCPTANWSVDIQAYMIDANGARVRGPYMRLSGATQIAQTYDPYYSSGGTPLDYVIHLGAVNNNPSQRIPYPINGCRIYARNGAGVDHAIAGILGVSSN
jgi:hypothetical protein